MSNKKVLFIVGPTAAGKSNLAINIALRVNGEIVNADSRLVYKNMDIGTSKPTPKQLSQVPHHLIDIKSPTEQYNLREYLTTANKTISNILKKGKVPIIVGGTGQYIWALYEGWELDDTAPDYDLRESLSKLTLDDLNKQLEHFDPNSLFPVDRKNKRRIIRAIEKAKHGSVGDKKSLPTWDALIIGLHVERPTLHKKIAIRTEQMMKKGFLNEVKTLLNIDLPSNAPVFTCIGYKELIAFINKEYDLNEAIKRTTISTNRLVRHQNNWFKQEDERIVWFNYSNNSIETQKQVMTKVWSFL